RNVICNSQLESPHLGAMFENQLYWWLGLFMTIVLGGLIWIAKYVLGD
ncbi:MAG: hypothetical protein K0S71_1736, partial [Clostridia bacterium]|nr:hypothetical protein [Clostridia bacterium]